MNGIGFIQVMHQVLKVAKVETLQICLFGCMFWLLGTSSQTQSTDEDDGESGFASKEVMSDSLYVCYGAATNYMVAKLGTLKTQEYRQTYFLIYENGSSLKLAVKLK